NIEHVLNAIASLHCRSSGKDLEDRDTAVAEHRIRLRQQRFILIQLQPIGARRDHREHVTVSFRRTHHVHDRRNAGGIRGRLSIDRFRAKESVNAQTSSDAAGVASVMNVVRPSETDRDVLAMVSSRTYGLDLDQNETLLPQPYSMVGNGAGSVFKVFTAAAAVEAGYGIKNMLDV